MTLLNALTLTEYKRVNTERPVSQRRRKLALKLSEQIKLSENSEFQPTKVVWSMSAMMPLPTTIAPCRSWAMTS